MAVTTAGVSHTGMLVNETGNSVTLMGQEGKQQTILRTDLETLQATGKSLMPEGLEKDLSPQDLANVIAYLRSSGAAKDVLCQSSAAGQTDGRRHVAALRHELRDLRPDVVMERLYKNLGYWQSENDRAVWNVELPKAGRYAMLLNYACPAESPATPGCWRPADKTLSGKVVPTGSWDRYQEVEGGEIELPAGNQQIVFRSAGPINGNLLDLGGILLKPAASVK